MPIQAFKAGEIKGFTPGVDPTLSDTVFALSGRNYTFDSLGPKSSFGDRMLLPQYRTKPEYIQGVRLHLPNEDRCFTFDGDGIWEWDEVAGGFQCVYLTPDTSKLPFRWTWGFLSDYIFFCHPRTGILCYNLADGTCQPHSQVGIATPVDALAIVINNGMLCALDPLFFSWSNPSDGLDFTPQLGGGGFQLLSDRVSGTAIMLTSYTTGCLSWTTGGVLRSQFTGDAAVFVHRSLNTEYRPCNSFCTTRVDDDTVLILDERGLFQSKGQAPTIYSPGTVSPTSYTPLFNEFLIDFIQNNKLDLGTQARLEWDELRRHLYVMFSMKYAGATYDRVFVYYPTLDKWGEFNSTCYGIIPILIKQSSRKGNYYGYVDAKGVIRYWQETWASREANASTADLANCNLYYPTLEKIAQQSLSDSGRIMPVTGKVRAFDATGIAQRAGYYRVGTVTPKLAALSGLNAKLELGLFRPTGPSASDEASEVINVLIRSYTGLLSHSVVEDLEQETGTEDYETETGTEDLGDKANQVINYSLKVISTLDGIHEWQSAVPVLVQESLTARYFACSTVGVWHKIEVTADDPGDSFHLRSCEITAASAGRIL